MTQTVVKEQTIQQASVVSTATVTALKGLITKLQATKQAAAGTAIAHMLAEPWNPSCQYFGDCGGKSGGAGIDSATKDQVAKLLEGILGIPNFVRFTIS